MKSGADRRVHKATLSVDNTRGRRDNWGTRGERGRQSNTGDQGFMVSIREMRVHGNRTGMQKVEGVGSEEDIIDDSTGDTHRHGSHTGKRGSIRGGISTIENKEREIRGMIEEEAASTGRRRAGSAGGLVCRIGVANARGEEGKKWMRRAKFMSTANPGIEIAEEKQGEASKGGMQGDQCTVKGREGGKRRRGGAVNREKGKGERRSSRETAGDFTRKSLVLGGEGVVRGEREATEENGGVEGEDCDTTTITREIREGRASREFRGRNGGGKVWRDQVRREHGFYKDQEVDVRRAGMPVDGLPFGSREATDVK